MKLIFRSFLFACVLMLFPLAAAAQKTPQKQGPAAAVLSGTGKAGVFVVGSAAKGSWVVTKAVGKHVGLPAAKAVFLRAAPAVGKFVFKNSIKHLAPTAVKFAAL